MAKQRPEASRPKQARALKTEQTLLDALEKLLAQKSFADVTVSELALEAGVTTGAIYRRFVDKEDVLRAACQRFIERPQMHDVDFAEHLTDKQLLHEYFRGLMSYMLRNAHIMRAANYLNDIESFDHMNTARAASADWLACTGSHVRPSKQGAWQKMPFRASGRDRDLQRYVSDRTGRDPV